MCDLRANDGPAHLVPGGPGPGEGSCGRVVLGDGGGLTRRRGQVVGYGDRERVPDGAPPPRCGCAQPQRGGAYDVTVPVPAGAVACGGEQGESAGR
ncbi:hypothetical protein ACH4UM_12635 [Streptomyces sp. NPDC020801]|uniref:hypothetical protein n=1 Tax=unclassified Streptomyces TaxID=2593676 RepID=UPI003791AEB8